MAQRILQIAQTPKLRATKTLRITKHQEATGDSVGNTENHEFVETQRIFLRSPLSSCPAVLTVTRSIVITLLLSYMYNV